MWDLLLSRQELATVLLNYHIGRIVLGSAWNTDTTPTQPHRNSNTHRTKKNTTNVAIQQNSRKLLMMGILMSETCWAHKKWNKIASDIKLVFYSSTITMTHGPINIKRKLETWKSWFVPLFSGQAVRRTRLWHEIWKRWDPLQSQKIFSQTHNVNIEGQNQMRQATHARTHAHTHTHTNTHNGNRRQKPRRAK